MFKRMAVAQGAAVGGGSLIYANISVEADPATFEAGWPPEVTYQELFPHYQAVARTMNVQPVPRGQWPARTALMAEAAAATGNGDRFRPLELAVTFDPPGRGTTPTRRTRRARAGSPTPRAANRGRASTSASATSAARSSPATRSTSTTSPWPRPAASTSGRSRWSGRSSRRPTAGPSASTGSTAAPCARRRRRRGCWWSRRARSDRRSCSCGPGTSSKTLPRLPASLGSRWSANGDFLTIGNHPTRDVRPTDGPTITSAIDFRDGSSGGRPFLIEDGGFPDLFAAYVRGQGRSFSAWRRRRLLRASLREGFGTADAVDHVMPWFSQGRDAGNGRLHLRRRWWLFGEPMLDLDWDPAASSPTIEAIIAMHARLAGRPTASRSCRPPGPPRST